VFYDVLRQKAAAAAACNKRRDGIESYTRRVFTVGGGKHAAARETTARHSLFAVVIKGNGASLSERLDERDGRRDA